MACELTLRLVEGYGALIGNTAADVRNAFSWNIGLRRVEELQGQNVTWLHTYYLRFDFVLHTYNVRAPQIGQPTGSYAIGHLSPV